MAKGYVPSWCTACYRKGRTGEHFMKIAKAGNIHNFCHPNSLLTLQVRPDSSCAAGGGFTACCFAVGMSFYSLGITSDNGDKSSSVYRIIVQLH